MDEKKQKILLWILSLMSCAVCGIPVAIGGAFLGFDCFAES